MDVEQDADAAGQRPPPSDDDTKLVEIFSAGFVAPAENDDPFKLPTPSADLSSTTDGKEDTDAVKPSTDGQPQTKKQKSTKSGILKGKALRILKAPHAHSTDSADRFDSEEERLKFLPDCCDYVKDRYEEESKKDMTSAWFAKVKLDPVQQKNLCFSESLLLVEEGGNPAGKTYCSVTLSKWEDIPCFCVHCGSFGKFSTGLESGTTITSFVDFHFKPIQEFVHEWATVGPDTVERKTFLINEGNDMPCKVSLTKNKETVGMKCFNIVCGDMDTFISEGGNIVLQRFLIQDRRTHGTMNLQCLSYTGKVVKVRYAEVGSGWENVKGKQIKTWGIRRTVFINDDEEQVWDSLYNVHSRLMLRCQPDSPQALIPLWFESVMEFDKQGNFTGTYPPFAWACDPELFSKYLIKKDEVTFDNRRYIMDHPEVRALLSDYLQAVLFRKPKDIIDFTKQYFESFGALRGKMTKSTVKQDSGSGAGSSYFYGSFISSRLMGELGEGEWLGEGENAGDASFYPVNPTVDYVGLQKVDDDKGDENNEGELEVDISVAESETEDDLVVNELGYYVRDDQDDMYE